MKYPKNIRYVTRPTNTSDGLRVEIRWKNKRYTKFYSLDLYGEKGALERAIKWRNETEQKIEQPRSEYKIGTKNTKRNKSGHVGIFFLKRKRGSVVIAKIKIGGVEYSKEYSLKTHNLSKAVSELILWRQETLTKKSKLC